MAVVIIVFHNALLFVEESCAALGFSLSQWCPHFHNTPSNCFLVFWFLMICFKIVSKYGNFAETRYEKYEGGCSAIIKRSLY